jgi:hypothetical protein
VFEQYGRDRARHQRNGNAEERQDVVSTFILVLNWWVDNRSTLSAREVDDVFRSLVFPALAHSLTANSSES